MNATNPLLRLKSFGQSFWLDYIRRGMIDSGELARLIEDDGLSGITSNPAIFEKAIAEHGDYDSAIVPLAADGMTATDIYETLALDDIRHAADLLRPVYEASGGSDGFVSFEVSPHLAHDSEATIAEGRRLWEQVARPNLMIKVPATRAGLPAIQSLIAMGVNVNVTLLFSVTRYGEVAEAHMAGLEERANAGSPVATVASVASFFLSRIDTLVDTRLDVIDSDDAGRLRGRAAIASARLAYQSYRERIAGPRWRALAALGARPQKLLWASTSTKDPAYDDLRYVEALIGPETVNTMPPETLAAYRDHGRPAARLEQDLDAAGALPSRLAALGIDLEAVSAELESQGVQKFVDPHDRLLDTLGSRIAELSRRRKGA
jgi:transaldolase